MDNSNSPLGNAAFGGAGFGEGGANRLPADGIDDGTTETDSSDDDGTSTGGGHHHHHHHHHPTVGQKQPRVSPSGMARPPASMAAALAAAPSPSRPAISPAVAAAVAASRRGGAGGGFASPSGATAAVVHSNRILGAPSPQRPSPPRGYGSSPSAPAAYCAAAAGRGGTGVGIGGGAFPGAAQQRAAFLTQQLQQKHQQQSQPSPSRPAAGGGYAGGGWPAHLHAAAKAEGGVMPPNPRAAHNSAAVAASAAATAMMPLGLPSPAPSPTSHAAPALAAAHVRAQMEGQGQGQHSMHSPTGAAAAYAKAQAHAHIHAAARAHAMAAQTGGGGKRKRTPKAKKPAKKSGKKGRGAAATVGAGAELTPEELAVFMRRGVAAKGKSTGAASGKGSGKKAAPAKKTASGKKASFVGPAPPGSPTAGGAAAPAKETPSQQQLSPEPRQSPPQPPKKTGPTVTIKDRKPRRIVNPLLEMPRYPATSGPGPTPPELIPNGGEFWNALELYRPEPDTFPVSYYARLLGYDVPAIAEAEDDDVIQNGSEGNDSKKEGDSKDRGEEEKKGWRPCDKFDPETVPHIEHDDPFLYVPEPGAFSDVVLRRQRRQRGHGDDENDDDSNGDDVLDYVDPVWRTILAEFRGYNGSVMSPASLPGAAMRPLAEDCVNFAREHGVLPGPKPEIKEELNATAEKKGEGSDSTTAEKTREDGEKTGSSENGSGKEFKFRFATMADVPTLGRLNASKRRFETLADISSSLKSPGQYFLLAEETDDRGDAPQRRPVGFVHYGFCWYKLGELTERKRAKERERESRENASWATPAGGAGSTTGNIRTPTVSELVLYVDDIQCGRGGVIPAAAAPGCSVNDTKSGDKNETGADRVASSSDEAEGKEPTKTEGEKAVGSAAPTASEGPEAQTSDLSGAGPKGDVSQTEGESSKPRLEFSPEKTMGDEEKESADAGKPVDSTKTEEETKEDVDSPKEDAGGAKPSEEADEPQSAPRSAPSEGKSAADTELAMETAVSTTTSSEQGKDAEQIEKEAASHDDEGASEQDGCDETGSENKGDALEPTEQPHTDYGSSKEKKFKQTPSEATNKPVLTSTGDDSATKAAPIIAKESSEVGQTKDRDSEATSRADRATTATDAAAVATNANTTDQTTFEPTALEDSPAALILTALALEHARSSDVLYGMLEVPRAARKFFGKYYRMKTLPAPSPSPPPSSAGPNKSAAESKGNEEGGGTEAEADSVPMACDLLKCSYRYAFLQRAEEEERRKSAAVSGGNPTATESASVRQRMLVRMPSAREAAASSVGDAKQDVGEGGASGKSTKPETRFFSSAITKNRTKTVGVRVCDGSQPSETGTQLLSLTESLARGGQEGTALKKDSATAEDASWKVMRCFSLPCQPPAEGPKVGGFYVDQAPKQLLESSAEGDRVAEKLMTKQKELLELEAGLDPKLRTLLGGVYAERLAFEAPEAIERREALDKDKTEFNVVLDRRREADHAWQAQLEQDMDAVCDVCADGEVTVDNQILFCEACNVAVHQKCYGINDVPEGDYFCRPCLYFERDKKMASRAHRGDGGAVPLKVAPQPLPICCELCPRRQGAFVRTINPHSGGRKKKALPKWAHVVCGKWQGLNYTEGKKFEELEDVSTLKQHFFTNGLKCSLCDGLRGPVNKCRAEECKNYMHVTCARSSGICEVVHGENHEGPIQADNIWTLCCPEHSNVAPEDRPEFSLSIEQLRAAAQTFPMEEATPKEFGKMDETERTKYFENTEYETDFLELVMKRREGARCSVCDDFDSKSESGKGEHKNLLSRCTSCDAFFHTSCYNQSIVPDRNGNCLCDSCEYTADHGAKAEYETPLCHMCNHHSGSLKKAFAIPQSKKKWRDQPLAYKRSLFGKQIWCHAVCGLWHPRCYGDETKGYDCSAVIMSDGHSHVKSNERCGLCGKFDKIKVQCNTGKCVTSSGKKVPFSFHLSCARQAGLGVNEETNAFHVKCFYHSRCEDVLRARLEDMIEFERLRSGNDLANSNMPMSVGHAAKLFHFGEKALACIGWAWRWADWWVREGDNWEPLLEEGQDETTMTDEELKRVPSTPESRCEDARRCRLSAFGAAVRNRDYDNVPGDDQVALTNALRAILHTKSLVGPLKPNEIDFFVDWLARVYRSNSPLLGFGDDKIPIDPEACKHARDGNPKHELGSRPLPGKQTLLKGSVFESGVSEVDDFLVEPMLLQVPKKNKKKQEKATKVTKKASSTARDGEPKRKATRRGRRSHSIDEEVAASLDDDEPLAHICEKKRELERLAADKEKEARKEGALREKKAKLHRVVDIEDKSEGAGKQNIDADETDVPAQSDAQQSAKRKRGKSSSEVHHGEDVDSTSAAKSLNVDKVSDGSYAGTESSQKKPRVQRQQKISDVFAQSKQAVGSKTDASPPPQRKRGRPRRQKLDETDVNPEDVNPKDESPIPVRKKAGRPRRQPTKKGKKSSPVISDRIPRTSRTRRGDPERELSINEELGRKKRR